MTLTNWERLNNAPFPLGGASAVQWNDYIFVLARDGTTLLYQTKLKLWSMLPSYPSSLSDNLPLVNHKGKVLTVTSRSEIVAFDVISISWRVMAGPKSATVTYIGVNNDTLYANARKYEYNNWQPALFSLTNDEWETHNACVEWDSKILPTSEYIFEKTTSKTYLHRITKVAETESDTQEKPPKEIALPPYNDFTLHVIKATLFSFGGRDEDNQPTSDVLRYNPDTDTWESAGYMRSARYNVAVTTMQQGDTTEVYVLGGELGSSALIMKPRIPRETKKTPDGWSCLTSIVEKCTLYN